MMKSTELEPSTSRKRRRDEKSEPDSESNVETSSSLPLEENLTFSDTLMALRMMCAQFPHIEKVSIQPFVLQSQLYSSIKDRTQVDRELELLRRDRVLRIFKLNTGQDDHAIMFVDDYTTQIDRVVKRMEEKKQNDLSAFEWFKTHVLESKLDTSISHQELVDMLDIKHVWKHIYECIVKLIERDVSVTIQHPLLSVQWSKERSLLSLGGKVKEEHISQLINAGLLIRQLIAPNMYWFSIPNIGSVLKGLSQGRKELLSFLSRRKYKEMMLASLEQKRLRFSPLDMRFHLRDLIGSGHLKTVQTPTGLIVQVARD